MIKYWDFLCFFNYMFMHACILYIHFVKPVHIDPYVNIHSS